GFTMTVHDSRRGRSVKDLRLLGSNSAACDLQQVKTATDELCHPLARCQLAADQPEIRVELPLPVALRFIVVEFASFHESHPSSSSSSRESLQCPRCNRVVTSRHGMCAVCHENAFQCRQCRAINYDNLHAFLCPQCGHCRYGRFEFALQAHPCPSSIDPILSEEASKKVAAALEAEAESATRLRQQLQALRRPIARLVSSILDDDPAADVSAADLLNPGPISAGAAATGAGGGGGPGRAGGLSRERAIGGRSGLEGGGGGLSSLLQLAAAAGGAGGSGATRGGAGGGGGGAGGRGGGSGGLGSASSLLTGTTGGGGGSSATGGATGAAGDASLFSTTGGLPLSSASISAATAAAAQAHVSRRIAILGALYADKCRAVHRGLATSAERMGALQMALAEYHLLQQLSLLLQGLVTGRDGGDGGEAMGSEEACETSEGRRRAFVAACVEVLGELVVEEEGVGQDAAASDSWRAISFLLRHLCNTICPTRPEPEYEMLLIKAATQEEFLPGRLQHNPYSSKQVGPLMRDVKNLICKELELHGLMDDDYGMELLVGGQICSLGLSVRAVYEQVWKQRGAMSVTFRLQGLDGEATEPIVKELEEGGEEATDPEKEFAAAAALVPVSRDGASRTSDVGHTPGRVEVESEERATAGKEREEGVAERGDEVQGEVGSEMGSSDGLLLLLRLLEEVADEELASGEEDVSDLLKLLHTACLLRTNRVHLLRSHALPRLLDRATRAALYAHGVATSALGGGSAAGAAGVAGAAAASAASSQASLAGSAEAAADTLLRIVDLLMVEGGEGGGMGGDGGVGSAATAEKEEEYRQDEKHEGSGRGEEAVRVFLEKLTAASLSQAASGMAGHFERLVGAIRLDGSGLRLRTLILEKGIPQAAVRHLLTAFPPAALSPSSDLSDLRPLPVWQRALALPSLPLLLGLLLGLCRGHPPTQRVLLATEGRKGVMEMGREEGGLETGGETGVGGEVKGVEGTEKGVLPLLLLLEGVVGYDGLGARAEALLEVLSGGEGSGVIGGRGRWGRRARGGREGEGERSRGGGRVDEEVRLAVAELRAAAKERRREKAMRRRMELMKSMGVKSQLAPTGAHRIVLTSAKPSLGRPIALPPAMRALRCMVCHEGYPPSPQRADWRLHLLQTLLRPLHLEPHLNDKQGGSKLVDLHRLSFQHHPLFLPRPSQACRFRPQAAKREWDGAALRNGGTLCNALFPLRGPQVSPAVYARGLDTWWESVSSLGHVDGSRFLVLLRDLRTLIARFVLAASFSTDCHGGGRESNARFLPFQLHMLLHLSSSASSSQRHSLDSSLSALLELASQLHSRLPSSLSSTFPRSSSASPSSCDSPSRQPPSSSSPSRSSPLSSSPLQSSPLASSPLQSPSSSPPPPQPPPPPLALPLPPPPLSTSRAPHSLQQQSQGGWAAAFAMPCWQLC
ncbi:unnamed protein product, partial [Closterium sp. Yama58-4]